MTKGWMDPNILKFYLVLHMDEAPSFTLDTTNLLATMKKTFGKHCFVIHLPAPLTITEWAPSSIWLPLLEDHQFLAKYFPEQIGNLAHIGPEFFIAQDTVTSICQFIQHLVDQLVAYMQQSATHWNETVAAPRRGLTGRFFTASKKYFSRPTTSLNSASAASSAAVTTSSLSQQFSSSMSINSIPTLYAFDAHESILRRLGDYLFFLHQHAKAASIYQTAARSFSYDKAWKHHACSLEMAAVCQTLTSSVPKELDLLHEQLLQSSATKSRNATRATLLLTHVLLKDHPAVALQLLLRMVSRETDLVTALFLEQIALLYATIKKKRLSVKYLVLAGNKYGKVGLRRHALFCFTHAMAHFPSIGWDDMRDHVNASMARHFFQLSLFDKALLFMLKLVRPFQTQSLEELIFLYRHHPSPSSFYEILVPSVQLRFTNSLCVNESARWKLCFENSMNIPITLTGFMLGLSSTCITIRSQAENLTLLPLSSAIVTLEVTAHLQGSFLVYHVETLMNNTIPVRLPFLIPVPGAIHPPQPRLEAHWEGLPSSAFVHQVSLVTLTLTNTGHVATGDLQLTYGGLHLDSEDMTWGNLAPQSCIKKTLSVQWLHSSIYFEWSYLQSAFAPFRVSLYVPLTPLFQETCYVPISPGKACVTVSSLSNPMEGTVLGTTLPTFHLAPHMAYTHVVSWTAPGARPYRFLDPERLYFQWQWSPSVFGLTPLVCTAPQVACKLVHEHAGTLYAPMPVSVQIANHSDVPLQFLVQVSSNPSMCMAGLVEWDPWVQPHEVGRMGWLCYPLSQGVHDLSELIRYKLVKEHQGIALGKIEQSFLVVPN